MRALIVIGVAAAALSVPSAAGAVELRSGPLTATVKAEPFALEFRDAADGDVLRTLSGVRPAASYGPLGYSFDLRVPVVNNAYFGYDDRRPRARPSGSTPPGCAAPAAPGRARSCSTWRRTTRSATGSR